MVSFPSATHFTRRFPSWSLALLLVPVFASFSSGTVAAQEDRGELRGARNPAPPPPSPPNERPPGPPPPLVKVPYAGFRSQEAPEALSHHLPIPRGFGLLITDVWKDSPAEAAGLQRHDLLLRLGDQQLANPGQLNALIRARKPGETISLTVFRGGTEWEVHLTLWEAEEREGRRADRHEPFADPHGEPGRPTAERVRRPQGPEMDLSAGAAFSRELLQKTQRIGDEALRKFREIEPFQFSQPPAEGGVPKK